MEQNRLHALDAIRGIALLLGLLLHGSISFWPGLDSVGFPVSDNSKSMTLTYMFYVLHMFRMTVFFLIAGFFAHLSLTRKGYPVFLKDRFKRIAIPMICAWLVSLILMIPVVLWAASKFSGLTARRYCKAHSKQHQHNHCYYSSGFFTTCYGFMALLRCFILAETP